MNLIVRLFSAAALAGLVFGLTPMPASTATLSPAPHGGEIAFVRSIQKDLGTRFATVKEAQRAGYFRYTNEDNTGAISYADLHWHSSDPQHPSQLWYDVHGNLLGADFSELQSASPTAPHLWAVDAARWLPFRAHIHYVLTGPGGTEMYGATGIKKFTAAGGNPLAPRAQTLVKMHIAKSAAGVKRVFLFPAIWDLIVWIKPNPNGAFAEHNPAVVPSAKAERDSM